MSTRGPMELPPDVFDLVPSHELVSIFGSLITTITYKFSSAVSW